MHKYPKQKTKVTVIKNKYIITELYPFFKNLICAT